MKHQPRKRFGQNFLHDKRIVDAIVASIAASPNQSLVEIGPGKGALTHPLLRAAKKLTVIEIDRDLVAALDKQRLEGLTIFSADALQLDFNDLYEGIPLRIVGNLPYNISTPLLLRFVNFRELIDDVTVMLQKEVIDRLTATPGHKNFGRLSVLIQSIFTVEHVISVPPNAFKPPPKVQSGVIKLTTRKNPEMTEELLIKLQHATRLAFANKRKTLRNNLQKSVDISALGSLGIDPQRRAETLTLEEFHALAGLLQLPD